MILYLGRFCRQFVATKFLNESSISRVLGEVSTEFGREYVGVGHIRSIIPNTFMPQSFSEPVRGRLGQWSNRPS